MSKANNSSLASKKITGRAGGFSDALSIAADLGFPVSPSPSKVPDSFSFTYL